MQLRGLFDVEKSGTIREEWEVDLPVSADDEDWHIGLIYGPSGCGKTTIADELFGEAMVSEFDWPADRALIDGFPESMATNEITALLSSVGFSSPPSWLKPYGVLSNGEQFRSTVARALAESPSLAVIDEFTSVVDRQVAQIGSAAVAKAVRRRGQKVQPHVLLHNKDRMRRAAAVLRRQPLPDQFPHHAPPSVTCCDCSSWFASGVITAGPASPSAAEIISRADTQPVPTKPDVSISPFSLHVIVPPSG